MDGIRIALLLSGVSTALMVTAPVSAQTAAPAQSGTASPDDRQAGPRSANATDTDIVVTAQKREQLLVEVPQSITVVGGAALEQRQARSLSDFAALVPGLQIEQANPGNTRVVLRGINAGGASSTVSVYVDDTPFGASTTQTNGAGLTGDFDTFDIERLEVLRGPQGTLYGANSLGGLIKYVTVAPKLRITEARGQAGVEMVRSGGTGYYGSAVLNVPLGDTLALRASGFFRRTAGFIDAIGIAGKDVNSSRSYGGRASLLFRPSDAFSVRLSALAQNIRVKSRNAFDADPASFAPIARDPFTAAPIVGENRYQRFEDSNAVDYRLYTGTAAYDFGFATVTSVTSYSRLFGRDRSDVSFNDVGAPLGEVVSQAIYGQPANAFGVYYPNQATQKKFTQEVRLASPSSRVFEWLVGGYYTRETGGLFQRYFPYTAATGVPVTPPPPIPGFTELVLAQLDPTYSEYAGFASGTLHLGPRFDITAGGRYSRNRQHVVTTLDGALFGGRTVTEVSSREGVFTWSVSPRFEFAERSAIYARVAKGYRPGGPNVTPPGAPADFPSTTRADTLISYEAGVRAETADRRLAIDASVYYIDWKDTLITAVFQSDAGPVAVDANGKGAKSYGFETTVTLRPTRGLSVLGSIAYTRASLRGNTGNGGFDGDQLPFAPRYNATLSADYSWNMPNGGKPYVGADVTLVADRPGNFDNGYQTAFGRRVNLDGYATANLRAGVSFGAFDLSIYAKNVTNARGLISVGALGERPGGAIAVTPIQPRTVGATLGVSI